jgi:glycyl-tRNA synthetase
MLGITRLVHSFAYMNNIDNDNKMEKIVSLCKRRGFVYPGSEIYGGLSGTWDYGPYGFYLKRNIMNAWFKRFVESRDNMYPIETTILMNQKVWEASEHVAGFTDPLAKCEKCKKRYRADQLEKNECPSCGGVLSEERAFNLMFTTHAGAVADEASQVHLRPETAQGMFVNFKNIIDSLHPRLPFGLAQVGRSFRNEISPRDFLFRTREFDIMEFEYFVRANEWDSAFAMWKEEMWKWITDDLQLDKSHVNELEVPENDRAHYSKRTVDFEYDYPFGKKELYGLAYRGDFDLRKHQEFGGTSLEYRDEENGETFLPHVIEPTFGLERTVLAVLAESYREDEMGGERRTYLALPVHLAPVKVAVFPLLRNKPDLVKKAREIYDELKTKSRNLTAVFDDNGNIGKRYRRQDEIGTPFCVTVDFNSLEDDTVTVRKRDTGEQERVAVGELTEYIKKDI